MRELENMNREEIMKEEALKLTYGGMTPGNTMVTDTAMPSNAVMTRTATQTNTTVVQPTTPVVPAGTNQPGKETNILMMLSSLLTTMNAQNAGGNNQPAGVQKPAGTEVIFQNARVDPLSLPYKPNDSVDISKFTPMIAWIHFPTKLKMPSYIGQYDGTQDPDDHVHMF
jgi:hypothetical protein